MSVRLLKKCSANQCALAMNAYENSKKSVDECIDICKETIESKNIRII